VPVHRISGVLQQVGAGFVCEAVSVRCCRIHRRSLMSGHFPSLTHDNLQVRDRNYNARQIEPLVAVAKLSISG
jgi:hypothetical protein